MCLTLLSIQNYMITGKAEDKILHKTRFLNEKMRKIFTETMETL